MEPEEEEDDQMAALEEDNACRMVACELEAAEALAGLCRCGGELSSGESERQLVPEVAVTTTGTHDSQGEQESRFSNKDKEIDTTASDKKGFERTDEKIVKNIPSQLCSTSCQSNTNSSNTASKLIRPKLSEAEKEERKLRRVLANRESARQTIRRRQAMYLELTRKAADVTKENENLKKEKELAVEQYNSLKDNNEFLKARLAKFKKTESRETRNKPKTLNSDKSCSSTMTTPVYLQNPSSAVPCFFPSFIPSLDVSQIQYASHSNIPQRNLTPCPHQGQENTLEITTPGTPLFVVPVPWLLSFLTDSSTHHTHPGSNDRQNITCSCSDTSLHENNSHLNRAEASNSKKTMSTGPRNCQVHDTCHKVVSAPENGGHGCSEKRNEPIIRPHKTSEDAFAASEARRRRKELMKLRDVHCNRVHPR